MGRSDSLGDFYLNTKRIAVGQPTPIFAYPKHKFTQQNLHLATSILSPGVGVCSGRRFEMKALLAIVLLASSALAQGDHITGKAEGEIANAMAACGPEETNLI